MIENEMNFETQDYSNLIINHNQETEEKADNSSNNAEENGPDPDTIKMFVGQIPKGWDENKLKEFFEQYGPIYHLNVLRDKETDNSRGCCFVTFYHRKDAINAQNVLHNIHVMPGLNHPVQMKPADIENRNDRKLFVGMLSKTMAEDDVRDLFKEFGQIEDCSILRENGKSKGCAFLTFVNRSCAHQAIRKMNQSQIFEGCTKPIVVKFADAGKDKNMKRSTTSDETRGESNSQNTPNPLLSQQPTSATMANQNGMNVLNNLVMLLQQPGLASLLESARVLQQIQTVSQPHQTPIGQTQPLINSLPSLNNTGDLQSIQFPSLQPQQSTQSSQQNVAQHAPASNLSIQTTTANLLNLATSPAGVLFQPNLVAALNPHAFSIAAQNAYAFTGQPLMAQISPTTQQPFGQMMMSPSATAAFSSLLQSSGGSSSSSDKSRGPDGCNLFIYHLPQEFTDADLYATFCSFGSILSAKVFIDKQTNLSKCFGFVSYSDEASAQNAIKGMNGHQIGNKRLKVQLKRSEKPY